MKNPPLQYFGFSINEHSSFIDVCDNAFASKHYHCTVKPYAAGRGSFGTEVPQDDIVLLQALFYCLQRFPDCVRIG